MPEEDLYRTYLDNQRLNSNNSQNGNPQELLNFIKSSNLSTIDAFIISIDQMTSGGLVASRAIYDDYIEEETAILKEIFSFIGEKPLYLLDTVMRLASTVGYNGYSLTEYTNLRNYGMKKRFQLPEEELTLENVIASYNLDHKKTEIDYKGYHLSEEQYQNYLSARTRKLKLSTEVIKLINRPNTYYMCGIDDSSNTLNIQMNEVNYLKSLNKSINIFPGTDELGMLCLTKVYQDLIGYKSLKVKINYYGDENLVSTYDGISINENLLNHLNALNIKADNNHYDFEILVLVDEKIDNKFQQNADLLVKKMKDNFKNNLPMAIIDATTAKNILPNQLLENDNLSLLLGYSSWNTAGNAIGIALSQSVARLHYLYSDYSLVQNDTTKGQISLLAYSLIKDITYKNNVLDELATFINNDTKNEQSSTNFYPYLKEEYYQKLETLMNDAEYSIKCIKNCLLGEVYDSLNKIISKKKVAAIEVSDFRFPWYRTFEITFKVDATIKNLD